MEEDHNSEELEVAPQDHDSESIESEASDHQSQASEGSHDPEDKQEKNWRELRKKQREAEYTVKMQQELIQKLMESSKNQQPTPQEVDEFADLAPDDFLTREQSERFVEKRASAIVERKYQELRAQEEKGRFKERLNQKYSDFNDIVNPDSIEQLEKIEPELAQTIADLKDPYKMGVQTYKFIKALGINDTAPERRHSKEVAKKMEKSEKSVQSPQAFNKRPMAQAFALTEAEKTKLYEEMMGSAGKAGFGY